MRFLGNNYPNKELGDQILEGLEAFVKDHDMPQNQLANKKNSLKLTVAHAFKVGALTGAAACLGRTQEEIRAFADVGFEWILKCHETGIRQNKEQDNGPQAGG